MHKLTYVFKLLYKNVHVDSLGEHVRRGVDKSLARPGRKQATATKFGIYSPTSHKAQYTS
jgi:hypothetical protein